MPTSARQHEFMSCQLAAFFKLDFACPLKVAVFVGFLNNSSFNDVNSSGYIELSLKIEMPTLSGKNIAQMIGDK